MKRYFTLLLPISLMLSGCSDTTEIQRIYTDVRDDCRGYAENNIGQYSQGGEDERNFNAKLTSLFSDCMFEQGWTVAAPPKEGDGGPVVVAGNNPNDWGTSPQHPEILASSSRSSAAAAQPAARSAATVQEPVEPGHSATPAAAPVPITRQNMNQSSNNQMNRQSLSRSATAYGNTRGFSASASRSSSAVVAGSRSSSRSSSSSARSSNSSFYRSGSYGASRSSSSSNSLMNRNRSSR